MFNVPALAAPMLQNSPQMWRRLRMHAGRGWRAWVAVLTIISFLLLVSTAATHHHTSSLEDQGCSLCTAVAHKLSGDMPVLKLAQTVTFLAYQLPPLHLTSVSYSCPLLFPPSCGPPALS